MITYKDVENVVKARYRINAALIKQTSSMLYEEYSRKVKTVQELNKLLDDLEAKGRENRGGAP